jgi:hypothetical protein
MIGLLTASRVVHCIENRAHDLERGLAAMIGGSA